MAFLSTTYESPIGELTLCSADSGICGLWMAGQKYFGGTIPQAMELTATPGGDLREACAWLDDYFAGLRPRIADLRLSPIGGEFRQAVWKNLAEIPYGEVITYGEIARRIAAARGMERLSAQAVGGAVGHNPIGIIIPCHRVVGANGSLTGYAGGLDKKIWLLEHEGVDMRKLHRPTRGTAL